MDISWLNKRIAPEQKTVIEKLETISTLINETIRKVKKISSYLRPSILDDLGLAAAIEWEGEEFQQRTGIACSINIELEDIMISTDIGITLFRILQEALTNIARHAKSTKVRVSLKKGTEKLILVIQDNGIGITEEQVNDPKSIGLFGIHERVSYI
jgi:two-component system sensor histidine kinase UhpB